MSNAYVISSDCPNGPKEFLNSGKNGLLFKNNHKKSLLNSLKNYCSLSEKKVFTDKVILKRNVQKYTMFRHYLALNKILSI